LLPSVAAAVDFELLFDWKLLLCCRGEPACRYRWGGRRRWIRLRAGLLLGGRGIEQGGKRLGVCLLRRWHGGWPLL
jgi:hypothetical protein